MKDKFNLGWYLFAMIGGFASGAVFSKTQYRKGQADAYEDIGNSLKDMTDGLEDFLEEHKVEES